MRKSLLSLLAASLALSFASAQPATPAAPATTPVPAAGGASAESIERLLEVSHTQTLIQKIKTQVDGAIRNGAEQAAQMQHLSPDDHQKVTDEAGKLVADMDSYLDWSKLQTIYVNVYSQTFTQKEVDAMIAFYSTPEGQSVVDKLPMALQKCVAIMQPQVMQRMQESRMKFQQFMAQLAKPPAPAPAAPAPAKQG